MTPVRNQRRLDNLTLSGYKFSMPQPGTASRWPAVACAALLFGARAQAAEGRYDVSYLWTGDQAQALAYRDRVLGVLGPAMEEKLLVVKGADLFGLIYDRNGDARSSAEVAARHGRILKARGLETPAPIASRDWPVVHPAVAATAPRPPEEAAIAALPDLERRVDDYIKELRRRGRLSHDEQTSWSAYDLTSGEKLFTINEDKPMQAASMVKPFFALAFFHRVDQGRLKYDAKARRNMRLMLQRSNNRATNWVLKRLGGPQEVDRLLRSRYGGILPDTKIVEYIPPGGRTYRNRASVHDYGRFLYALWNQDVPGAAEIKRLMGLPGADRLTERLDAPPDALKVYNKTGSTRRLCGEMGILEVRGPDARSYAYTLIGVIEKRNPARNYSRWIRSRGDVIREVSRIVYQTMATRHLARTD